MIAVQCPYCRNELPLKKAPPGMYTSACTHCGRKFYLAVPEDPGQPPVVAPIPAERDQAERPTRETRNAPAGPAERAAAGGSQGADAPVLTLPEQARTAPTLTGTPQPGRSPENDAEPPMSEAVGPSSPLAWARLRTGSVPRVLDGYVVLQELRRAALGPVYLAKQMWFGRTVNLNVMKLLWARNAPFVARFTREAYAAIQLRHSNLTQLQDFGEARGTTFFCTEPVSGQNMAELIARRKRIEPSEAASFILQAARGLKHAVDQSVFHRDVKPENLWVDQHGLLKVADLGLVNSPELAEFSEAVRWGKTPQSPATSAGSSPPVESGFGVPETAVGSPGFMAPEQAGDPARVDARADIYSLGCTLYFMVTGRPPFEGRSALEILRKQQDEPLVAPDQVVKAVPGPLAAIILRMMAKKQEERYGHISQVIDALEGFVGVSGAGSFSPREEEANLLENCANTFKASPSARLRGWVMPVILAVCFALGGLCLLTGHFVGAGMFLSLGLWTGLADFVLVGIRQKSALFVRVCELVARARLSEWLTGAAALAILAALLLFVQLFWVWLGLGFLGVGIAVALHAAFDRQAEAERRGPVEQIQGMLRAFRLQGRDEDALRQFVCVYSGSRWEEFYEALFGYDAKREARLRWGRNDRSVSRPKFASWRDPIADWLDAAIAARRDVDYLATLYKVEERNLQSLGVNLVSARRKAQRAALAMVATAADFKREMRAGAGAITVNRSIVWSMHEAAAKPEKVLLDHEHGLIPDPQRERTNYAARALEMVLAPKVRFLAGAALFAGCIAWMHQNTMISAEHAAALVEAAKAGDVGAIQSHAHAGVAHARERAALPTHTLELPGFPPTVLALVSSFGAGVGGLILIASAFFAGTKITFFAIPAAAIPVSLPRLWHPMLGGIDPSLVPSIVGVAILAAGVFFRRR